MCVCGYSMMEVVSGRAVALADIARHGIGYNSTQRTERSTCRTMAWRATGLAEFTGHVAGIHVTRQARDDKACEAPPRSTQDRSLARAWPRATAAGARTGSSRKERRSHCFSAPFELRRGCRGDCGAGGGCTGDCGGTGAAGVGRDG